MRLGSELSESICAMMTADKMIAAQIRKFRPRGFKSFGPCSPCGGLTFRGVDLPSGFLDRFRRLLVIQFSFLEGINGRKSPEFLVDIQTISHHKSIRYFKSDEVYGK